MGAEESLVNWNVNWILCVIAVLYLVAAVMELKIKEYGKGTAYILYALAALVLEFVPRSASTRNGGSRDD